MSDPFHRQDGSAPFYAPPPPYSEKEPHHGGLDPGHTPVEATAPTDYGAAPPMPIQHQPYYGVPEAKPILQPSEAASDAQPANVPNYLCYAICTMFCCLPLGTAALVYSLLTRESNLTGNITAAQRTSKMAWMFATIALGVGLGILILYIIMLVFILTR